MSDFKPCIVVPVYNHEHAIGAVLQGLLRHNVPVILVDDGSCAACAEVLDALAAQYGAGVVLERLPYNQGKGKAVLAGFCRAGQLGYSHALQIDADGQHQTDDVPKFLAQAAAHPAAVIAGFPIYDDSVPKARLYGRYATHVWVWINTLSLEIKDSMCGFRAYPVAAVNALAARQAIGSRMNFDTDIVVRLFWEGLRVINVGTRVSYPMDGVSHFRVWRDNVLITRMHTLLFFGMLPRIPRLLARKWQAK